ncbi:MAG: hypothetical protein WC823_05740 [Parcubacteria group bacterium]|jgi:hypothetical protein
MGNPEMPQAGKSPESKEAAIAKIKDLVKRAEEAGTIKLGDASAEDVAASLFEHITEDILKKYEDKPPYVEYVDDRWELVDEPSGWENNHRIFTREK